MREEEIQELIRLRLEQASQALRDAQMLLDGGGSSQAVVNRSYYAMFYAALALLQRQGHIPSKHRGVLGLFDTGFVRKGVFPKELSSDFHTAFEYRQDSDYKSTRPMPRETAGQLHLKAVRFVETVRGHLLPNPAQPGD